MASPSLLRSSQRLDRRFISSLGSTSAVKKPIAVRHSVATSPGASFDGDDADADRVRVAVRVRPKNEEDFSDSEFNDCLELQPELRRLKLRKNSWNSESYQFDEVFTEVASQKRVYEAIAKPVVQSVLNGYNGTIMAYGQTGTGKTYTIGRIGKDNLSERGIMVRALEDILADISPDVDKVSISYLQLYLESIQDLLAPDKANIAIIEDAKSGEVCIPNATVVKIREIEHFLQVLQIGEANRHSANTKMNARSSRSHAILVVYVHRVLKGKDENEVLPVEVTDDNDSKSKLLIIDLAGSERIDKSGVDGHMLEEARFINLSLTCLGKCINALAENSPHIPTRDSKLTRLLCDSFGGTARASLIVTVGPSVRHYSETASTIMFGQRAMKVVNMLKVKEEYDYESQCRKLDRHIDNLTSELERVEKANEQLERILYERSIALNEAEVKLVDAEKKLAEVENMPISLSGYQIEDSTCHEAFATSEKKVKYLARTLEEERCHNANIEKQLIEVLAHGSRKFSEASRKINLMAELANHHQAAVDANTRAEVMAIWFGLFLFALFSLNVLY